MIAAAAAAAIIGLLAINGDRNRTQEPVITPSPTPTETTVPIPTGRSEVLAVRQVGEHGLQVDGEPVPGRWVVNDSRLDVWVAMNIGEDDYESQWWGNGTKAHQMPPAIGKVLRGGVVISQDAHWIVWTRPEGDVFGQNPSRVMEVVDTATGQVRWSRQADEDAPDIGALTVTNDGVVVFAHCLERVFDSGGWPQCDDARVDVWAPGVGVTGTVPAEVRVGNDGPPGTVTSLLPLVQASGAHNGLLVQETPSSRPQYVRVSKRGDIEVVATLPRGTLAVTADERFALLADECPDGVLGCRYWAMPLDGGERRAIPSLAELLDPRGGYLYSYVVERDDLLLVRGPEGPGDPAVGRCSLAQALCVRIGE